MTAWLSRAHNQHASRHTPLPVVIPGTGDGGRGTGRRCYCGTISWMGKLVRPRDCAVLGFVWLESKGTTGSMRHSAGGVICGRWPEYLMNLTRKEEEEAIEILVGSR